MNCKDTFHHGDILLSLPQVLGVVGVSKATLYRHIAEGAFPRPIRVGQHRVSWIEAEVHGYLTQRIQERNEALQGGGGNHD